MKTVVPNIVDVMRTKYVSQLGRLRKFKRMWGTTYIQGHEVFAPRHIYYPTMSEKTKALAKYLGVSSELSAKQNGVSSCWLYLNPDKAPDTNVNYDVEFLARNLSKSFQGGENITISIGPKVVHGGLVIPPITTPDSNPTGLLQEIKSKYLTLWREGYQITTSADDAYSSVLLTYLLRSYDIPYEVTDVRSRIASYTYNPLGDPKRIITEASKKWQITVNVPDIVINSGIDIVPIMASELDVARKQPNNSNTTTKFLAAVISGATSPFTVDEDSKEYESFPTTISGHWIQNQGVWYLKTSFLLNRTISLEDRIKYVFGVIDSDYKKKKLKWYEVALAVIVVIVVTWLSWGTGTTAAAAAVAAYGATAVAVVTIAVAITVASMYIALAAMALHYLGAPNVSAALGSFQRTIAPLVRVANIIALVAVIVRAVQTGIQAATDAAAKEAAEQGVQGAATASLSAVIKEVGINLVDIVTERFVGFTTTGSFQVLHALQVVNTAFGLYQRNELKKISDDIQNYRNELAKEKELEESSKVSDLVKDMMASYPNPLTKDHSEYANIYDRPYEWWSTEFHTGNMQANTVSALWLSK